MALAELSDTELVLAARGDDGEAFGQLFDRWFSSSWNVARTIVGHDDLAADVAQDALLTAWQRLDQLENPDAFCGWLLRITRNRALNRLEKEQRSRATDDDVVSGLRDQGLPDPTGAERPLGPDSISEVRDRQELVWAAAAALGERDASLLDLHLRHGLSPAELAEELQVEANNAHQLLYRLRTKLGEAIGSYLLWRNGRPLCDGLAKAVSGDVAFNRSVAGSVAKHQASCQHCSKRRESLIDPSTLFAGVPLGLVPIQFKVEAAAALEAAGVPMGPAAGAGPIGGDGVGGDGFGGDGFGGDGSGGFGGPGSGDGGGQSMMHAAPDPGLAPAGGPQPSASSANGPQGPQGPSVAGQHNVAEHDTWGVLESGGPGYQQHVVSAAAMSRPLTFQTLQEAPRRQKVAELADRTSVSSLLLTVITTGVLLAGALLLVFGFRGQDAVTALGSGGEDTGSIEASGPSEASADDSTGGRDELAPSGPVSNYDAGSETGDEESDELSPDAEDPTRPEDQTGDPQTEDPATPDEPQDPNTADPEPTDQEPVDPPEEPVDPPRGEPVVAPAIVRFSADRSSAPILCRDPNQGAFGVAWFVTDAETVTLGLPSGEQSVEASGSVRFCGAQGDTISLVAENTLSADRDSLTLQ